MPEVFLEQATAVGRVEGFGAETLVPAAVRGTGGGRGTDHRVQDQARGAKGLLVLLCTAFSAPECELQLCAAVRKGVEPHSQPSLVIQAGSAGVPLLPLR